MSKLFVIRHGQASFESDDYDQLSPLGGRQSERLGRYLAERGRQFDAVYVGPRRRHHGTAEAMARGIRDGGGELPELRYLDELDEFPAFELFDDHGPADSQRILEEEGSDALMAAVVDVCKRWMLGELDSAPLESALAFEERVLRAVHTIRNEQGLGRNIAIITSGGPMTMIVKEALALAPLVASDLLWTIGNSAISEVHMRESDLRLVSFNQLAHLDDDDITHR